jgi:hypothetical protein
VQLQRFALVYDPGVQRRGYLLGGRLEADVIDADGQSHLFVVTDQYGSVRLVVGEHFLKVARDQVVVALAIGPLEGAGDHRLTVAIDGERQAGGLLTVVS